MPHSAVLLAGGKSTRMGRDKALIDFQGRPLWRHQLETLRQTAPQEILISAAADAPYLEESARVVPDLQPEQGPLGGIASVLRVIETEWALVLPIDMPNVTPSMLHSLLEEVAHSGRGIVSRQQSGKLEPLVAVYPKTALSVAENLLHSGERRLSAFVAELERRGLIAISTLAAEFAAQFANWNSPADIDPQE